MPGGSPRPGKSFAKKHAVILAKNVMRKELEQIRKIEMLLNGQLSGQEKADFEKEIAADPELQADVKAQQLVISGLERLMLRAGIKKAALRFKWTRWLFRGGTGFMGIAVI